MEPLTATGVWPRARELWHRLLAEGTSPAQLAVATFVGLLIATTPFYGLQMLLVLLVASVFRLNKIVALLACQVSMPPVYAFLVVGSLEIGNLLLHGDWLGIETTELPKTVAEGWQLLAHLSGVWLVGSLVVGTVLGFLGGTLVYILAVRSPKEEAEELAAELMASRSDRYRIV
jgi:uncharacterized protein (DUF2062 family)